MKVSDEDVKNYYYANGAGGFDKNRPYRLGQKTTGETLEHLDDVAQVGPVVQVQVDGTVEPLDVIKWKELYDYIEDAIDGCEDVGNTLERIVLKNG